MSRSVRNNKFDGTGVILVPFWGVISMVMLYFSGTGNSKYIATLFCRNTGATCLSIEEDVDFDAQIAAVDTVAFCYPIYVSRVPRIMREFVRRHKAALRGKKVIIFCTQLLFSGDGARALTDLLPRKHVKVIYAEHFYMPNNVCNMRVLPMASAERLQRYRETSERKMLFICRNIEQGKRVRRGFNPLSRILGLPQGIFLSLVERRANRSVKIAARCTRCGLCVSICPMDNLTLDHAGITHRHNCTMCYRCINRCPHKAITIATHGKVRDQYRGITRG